MNDKNGSYQAGSNIVNVALDAEGGLINRTVSHELYHFVKEWNQEAAGKLQSFVIDTLRGTETFALDKRRQDIARQYIPAFPSAKTQYPNFCSKSEWNIGIYVNSCKTGSQRLQERIW